MNWYELWNVTEISKLDVTKLAKLCAVVCASKEQIVVYVELCMCDKCKAE